MLADLIGAGIVILSIFIGYKRGFVKSVSKVCCWIISIIIAKFLNPYVTDFVKTTFVGDYIKDKITESMGNDLPIFLRQASEYTAESITNTVVGIISVILIIVVAYIVANFIIGALNIVSKMPVLSTLNEFLGGVCGLATGIFIVYLVLAIMVVADINGADIWIENSIAIYHMYRHNFLLNMIF